MDFNLSKQQQMVQKMYKEFAENEVKPLAKQVDAEEYFPKETVGRAAEPSAAHAVDGFCLHRAVRACAYVDVGFYTVFVHPAGDDVDDAAHGVRAVEHRGRSAQQKQQQLKKRNTRVRTKKKATSLAQSNDLFQPTLTEAMQPPSEMTETPLPINPGDKSSLNPKYTFESFVIGNSNSFAHAAALAIAENPAKDYNPFFMYGGVGLGKTHLMHAIGHKILQKHPQKRVLYTTSEKFTNELINSIKDGTSAAFRQKYRNIDVLLVDDVQFLANKERIQEEFFHTFNALKDANKQIILSSDRPPKEIKPLEDRLCSRFEGGLLADVQAPDLETRIAILKKKTLMDNLDVPLDVMTYIASHIDNNVRELEGALTRVVAYASFKHYPVTNELAVDVLKNTITKQETTVKQVDKVINIALIQETVAKYFKLTLADLNGKKRNRNIAFPRQIAMYLAREMTDASLPRIGGNFGGRDHTTVMHAHDKIKKQYQDNPKTASVIDEIRKLITS